MIVTVYVPGARDTISSVVAPLLHTKVYGPVPPDTDNSIAQSLLPLHLTLSVLPMYDVRRVGSNNCTGKP